MVHLGDQQHQREMLNLVEMELIGRYLENEIWSGLYQATSTVATMFGEFFGE